jgi:hypothetical protein
MSEEYAFSCTCEDGHGKILAVGSLGVSYVCPHCLQPLFYMDTVARASQHRLMETLADAIESKRGGRPYE